MANPAVVLTLTNKLVRDHISGQKRRHLFVVARNQVARPAFITHTGRWSRARWGVNPPCLPRCR